MKMFIEKTLEEINNQINEKGFEASLKDYSIAPSSTNGGEIGWIKRKV